MAIAFDAATTGGVTGSGTSLTWSHTCTGNYRYLFVVVKGEINLANDFITGATYATIAMTLLRKVQLPNDDRWTYTFGLVNPAAGANDVVVSASTACFILANSVSYTGVSAHGPEAQNNQSAIGVDTLDATVTTVHDNAWAVSAMYSPAGISDTGSGTLRVDGPDGTIIMDNGPISPPGVATNQVGFGPSDIVTSTFSLPPIASFVLS